MKVIFDEKFSVYVYSDEAMHRHHIPHCHVRSVDGEIVVALPTLKIIVGGKLPKKATQLLVAHLDEICQAWDKLNPEIKTKNV